MNKKIEIYYDGTCNMCTGFVRKIQKSSQGASFTHIDASDGAPGISREEAMHEVHVVDEKGEMHRGVDGILKVIEQFPRWRWAAKIGGLWFVRPFVHLGYRIVAANRHRFN